MLGPLVAAENQRFLYIVTRGTELDLRKRLRVRYYLSGRQGDELNNGAMAQLVARFHGMEEVGGSNPPSSTKNSDTQLVSVGFFVVSGRVVCLLCRHSVAVHGARRPSVSRASVTHWSGTGA